MAIAVDGSGDDFVVGEATELFRAEIGDPTFSPTRRRQLTRSTLGPRSKN